MSVHGEEAVWLEKRTGKGVWKHLWSFPEGDDLTRKGTPLPTVFHEFTHYKLTASPIHVLDAELNESDHGGWFSREDIRANKAFLLPSRSCCWKKFWKNLTCLVHREFDDAGQSHRTFL